MNSAICYDVATTEYQWPNPTLWNVGMVENRERQKTRYQGVVHVAWGNPCRGYRKVPSW